jgi:ABC-type branched-subunit amino acid transport system substrate-binding protein
MALAARRHPGENSTPLRRLPRAQTPVYTWEREGQALRGLPAHLERAYYPPPLFPEAATGRRTMRLNRAIFTGLAAACLVLEAGLAFAAGQYGPGVSDTEIKIGNTMPYSGPASSYGAIGQSDAAYFAMINERGGINGRKINFISRDDGYSPPKTVEQVRRLVEQDQVLLLFNTFGTPPNTAIQG